MTENPKRLTIVESIAEANRLVNEIGEYLPGVILMEDRYVDLETLIREIEVSSPDLMAGPEKDNISAMMIEELLPLLADEHGIHLIGICSHRLDGTKNQGAALFNRIEEFFRTAAMDMSGLKRTFLVIPDHVFRTIIEKRLLTSQEKRRAYLGEIENEEPILAFIGILLRAFALGASDVHIENDDNLEAPSLFQSPLDKKLSQKNAGQIRFRIQGQLEIGQYILPKSFLIRLVSSIKVLTKVKVEEKRLPQDGEITFSDQLFTTFPQIEPFRDQLAGNKLRLNFITPGCDRQNVTIRILKSQSQIMRLEQAVPKHDIRGHLITCLEQSQGLIILSGPTGCGKTTTLYAALHHLNSPEKKIITVEDPIEVVLPGIVQIEVENKIGRTFALILRALMRQDPNVILVGEIRDQETAETAIQAALTGHMVLTSLHAPDTVNSITRLHDLKIDAASIATSLVAIMSQRLVRQVCPKCSQKVIGNDLIQGLIGGYIEPMPIPYPIYVREANEKGCKECRHGYLSRFMIPEMLAPSPELKTLIATRGAVETESIREMAIKQGLNPLALQAISAIVYGQTTIDEIIRYGINRSMIMRYGRMIAKTIQVHQLDIERFQAKSF